MDIERRAQILSAYGRVLQNNSCTVFRARELPFDKLLICHALFEELLSDRDPQYHEQVKVALLSLDAFVSDDEFEAVFQIETAIHAIGGRVGTEGVDATRRSMAVWGDFGEKYQEVLRRVGRQNEETMSFLNRFFPSREAKT